MEPTSGWGTTGWRVRRLRGDKNQGDLAKEVGIRQSYLSAIENDQGNPSADVMRRLAAALGTTIDFLMCRTENPGIPQDARPTYLSEEAERIARMVDDMPEDGRQAMLRMVESSYQHYEQHEQRNRSIRELLRVIESTAGTEQRREVERRLGITAKPVNGHGEAFSF